MSRVHFPTAVIVVAAFLTACVPVKEQERADYMSDYSKLEQGTDDQWRYNSGKLGDYSSFYIQPVTMLIKQDKDKPTFTPEDLEDLKSHVVARITKHLTEDDGYAVVSSPGPGVATIRVAITDVQKTVGALNLSLFTKITGAGLGGIAAEAEIVDSNNGEQIAAAILWGSGSRVLVAGLTRLGDAKIVINRWSKYLRQTVDDAHGRGQ